MHKIYRSTQHIIAAQIVGITLARMPADCTAAPSAIIEVDTGREFTVPTVWAAQAGVQVGGYFAIAGKYEQGEAMFIPADRFATDYAYVGGPAGSESKKAVEQPASVYDFDAFVEYGRAYSPVPIGADTLPTSFQFHGQPVTHENDNCYIITHPGNPHGLRFERGQVLHVTADGMFTATLASERGELAEGAQA